MWKIYISVCAARAHQQHFALLGFPTRLSRESDTRSQLVENTGITRSFAVIVWRGSLLHHHGPYLVVRDCTPLLDTRLHTVALSIRVWTDLGAYFRCCGNDACDDPTRTHTRAHALILSDSVFDYNSEYPSLPPRFFSHAEDR